MEIEGYLPETFGPTSNKFIWAVCRYCGKPSRLRKAQFTKKGSACHKECRLKEQSANSPFSDPKVREKARETNRQRYGSEFASQNKEIANKISSIKKTAEHQAKNKETCQQLYGVDNVFQSEVIKEKIRTTNLDKYGTESAIRNPDVLAKKNQTMVDLYGVENPQHSEEIKEHIKDVNQEKHGCDYWFQSEEFKTKQTATVTEKYGCQNVMQDPEIRDRAKKTCLERYGFEAASQSPEIKAKIIQSHLQTVVENKSGNFDLVNILRGDEFWNLLKTQSLRDIADYYQLNYPSLTGRMHDDEFRDKYYSVYSFPKIQSQMRISNILRQNNIDHDINNRSIITPYELDIYIPHKNIAIEFNGSYWHSEKVLDVYKAKNKHYQKTLLCRQKNIRLVHIFEHTWEHRSKQMTSLLRSIMGLNGTKIHARSCQVTNEISKTFLDDNHLQGSTKNVLSFFNLVHRDNIVGTMTASHHHRGSKPGTVVLSRMCFADNTTVVGGASKLFKAFTEWAKLNGYKSIISWSDNCWTEGDIYKTLGFEMTKEYGPDYFYWDMPNNRYVPKQSQQKKKIGCPIEMTERDFCFNKKLYRIWDSGKKLWIYTL